VKRVILFLLLACALRAQDPIDPEVVVIVRNDDLTGLNKLLGFGYTVKYQSASTSVSFGSRDALGTIIVPPVTRDLIVFTLSPPSHAAVVAMKMQEELERKVAFDAKRAEYLKRKAEKENVVR
jgi:hypothetical protein